MVSNGEGGSVPQKKSAKRPAEKVVRLPVLRRVKLLSGMKMVIGLRRRNRVPRRRNRDPGVSEPDFFASIEPPSSFQLTTLLLLALVTLLLFSACRLTDFFSRTEPPSPSPLETLAVAFDLGANFLGSGDFGIGLEEIGLTVKAEASESESLSESEPDPGFGLLLLGLVCLSFDLVDRYFYFCCSFFLNALDLIYHLDFKADLGFDNECVLNIQSLAGEYFCPVCLSLVFPSEALQSRCTHLYCKPCFTYVLATTKVCPYDGYVVTEADSKPLVESDKALAEVIDRISVRCLFHRSGCSWQGLLSECTSHSSGCDFGSYLVVCKICGIQMVHLQVQKHAQNCPSTDLQALQNAESLKDPATSGTITTTNSSQTNSHPVSLTLQAQVSQTTNALPPASDSNQADTNAQVQGIASAAGTTAGQWNPQQFQQYYQQYPGYDPHQHYYPYQRSTTQQLQQQAPQVSGHSQVYAPLIQPHPQSLPEVQGQPLSHPHPQMQLQSQSLPLPQQQQTSQQKLQVPTGDNLKQIHMCRINLIL